MPVHVLEGMPIRLVKRVAAMRTSAPCAILRLDYVSFGQGAASERSANILKVGGTLIRCLLGRPTTARRARLPGRAGGRT